MSTMKTRNLSELHFGKRSLSQPLGPSVSGAVFLSPKTSLFPSVDPAELILPIKKLPNLRQTISDDSYDSSSSPEEKTVSPKVWRKNPLLVIQDRIKAMKSENLSSSTGQIYNGSIWERTKKELLDIEPTSSRQKRSKRKTSRDCSLDAKTARYYAKRQQAGWTGLGIRGRQVSSSSEEESARNKSRSPRRKRGSKDTSSVSSKAPSRDPSLVRNQSLPRKPSIRPDLPPSSNGAIQKPLKLSVIVPSMIPAIKITAPKQVAESSRSLSDVHLKSTDRYRDFLDGVSIEDWIDSRRPSLQGSLKSSVSTQSLFYKPSLASQYEPYPETPDIPRDWNIPSSRHSLPAGINNSVLGLSRAEPMSPEGVKSMREYFERLGNDTAADSAVPFSAVEEQQHLDTLSPKSANVPTAASEVTDLQRSPILRHRVFSEHGKMALVLKSSRSTELLPLTGGNITADSRFLHNALRISSTATKLLEGNSPNDQNNGPLHEQNIGPSALLQVSDGQSTARWNSDWQLHQVSSASLQSAAGSVRPTSLSAFDSKKLSVPNRLSPLREANSLELEKALEELDEFYDSLSAKSEDHAIKSTNETYSAGMRSMDSGLSSLKLSSPPEKSYMIKLHSRPQEEPDRSEYTKQWVHDEKHDPQRKNLQTDPLTTTKMIPPPIPFWSTPTSSSSLNGSIRGRATKGHGPPGGPDVRKDDYANRKRTTNTHTNTRSQVPNSSYLLMSVVYTPTVFTGSLEFQNYPGKNGRPGRPQPHLEMDDLLQRKIIHSQNTPLYKVTTDLSKQMPSSRNDYAIPNVPTANLRRSREPDVVRDDAAFRQLRNDRKALLDRPRTLDLVNQNVSTSPEKPAGQYGLARTKSVSNSIRQLASQFEAPRTEPKKTPKPFFRKTEKFAAKLQLHAVQAAMQVDGRRVEVRPPPRSHPTHVWPIGKENHVNTGWKQVSPKVSPMNDQQMEDLLFSLHSLPSPDHNKAAQNIRKTSNTALVPNPWERIGRSGRFALASKSGVAV